MRLSGRYCHAISPHATYVSLLDRPAHDRRPPSPPRRRGTGRTAPRNSAAIPSGQSTTSFADTLQRCAQRTRGRIVARVAREETSTDGRGTTVGGPGPIGGPEGAVTVSAALPAPAPPRKSLTATFATNAPAEPYANVVAGVGVVRSTVPLPSKSQS